MRLTNYQNDNLFQVATVIAFSGFVAFWLAKITLWLYWFNPVFFWLALAWWLYVTVFWAVHLTRNVWDRLNPKHPAHEHHRNIDVNRSGIDTMWTKRRLVRIGLDGSSPKFIDISKGGD